MAKTEKLQRAVYRGVRGLVWALYPRIRVEGVENLPEEAAIVVGNHSQMHGPIAAQLYFPGKKAIWCAGEMMHLHDVPDYAYQDFWSGKPLLQRPFYRLLSYIIAPLSVCVFNSADTVGVYRDSRIINTFKNTVRKLKDGTKILIFPETYKPYNQILCGFQENFVDVARLYYKQTGIEVPFVPLYLAPNLKTMFIGKPVRFCHDHPMEEERRRITEAMMEEITAIAESLPEHIVVPYPNIPKRKYTTNLSKEAILHEETGC